MGAKGGAALLVPMLLSDDGSGCGGDDDASWTGLGTEVGMGCWGRKRTI